MVDFSEMNIMAESVGFELIAGILKTKIGVRLLK